MRYKIMGCKNLALVLICSFLLVSGCENIGNNSSEKYSVSGTVSYNSIPVSDAAVKLYRGNQLVAEAMTDFQGEFNIEEAESDSYSLFIEKQISDSSYLAQSVSINLNEDLILDNLELPRPLELLGIEEIEKSIKLTWSVYDPGSFYEYRIYRHTSTALDDMTGTLVHIATRHTDTTFVDNGVGMDGGLARDFTYFYRIYVVNNYGRRSGSNIEFLRTSRWERTDFPVEYDLNQISSFYVPGGDIVAGVDFDGESLWVAGLKEIGGYYDNNRVRLIKYDVASATILKTFEYNDEYVKPSGLIWDGSNIWLNYGGEGGGDTRIIKRIDPDSGQVNLVYTTPPGVHDVGYDGNNIFYSYYFNRIEKRELPNLSVVETYDNPFGTGANFGIAYRSGEIWLSCKSAKELAILDDAGEHVGLAYNDILVSWNGFHSRLHLCFMGDNLILCKNSRIYVLDIVDRP